MIRFGRLTGGRDWLIPAIAPQAARAVPRALLGQGNSPNPGHVLSWSDPRDALHDSHHDRATTAPPHRTDEVVGSVRLPAAWIR